MKELRAVDKDTLAWHESERPELTHGYLRVVPCFSAAKHGTELAFLTGKVLQRGPWDPELQLHRRDTGPRRPYPFALGNATVGNVAETGPGVTSFASGDRVLVEEVPFRDEHVVPAVKCHRIPEQMSWKSAVCLDPGVFALGAVRDGHVRPGDRVAVFGMGAIGLMAVQFCRLAGATLVVAVEPDAQRRTVARDLGADVVVDPTACDIGLEIRQATGRQGADVCIEFSGSVQALQHAIRGVAFGGNVVCGAFPGPYPAGLDLGAEAHINTPNLIFSRACSDPNRDHPRWDLRRIKDCCLQWLVAGKATGEGIIGPVVPFNSLLTEYPRIVPDPRLGVKLGVAH
ncbi:MAG: hypothetical protein A3K19_01845 [Lentisphaerae bacterium RIFOXYB12_FULL_65_16]|nr:MAG: hypothetical protein A3K18_02490 [Lentisphaerae bacterium RIFOXYA12_64_32]OGV92728.1 MAG: hypothetical protein A3K19_01845 [Lentisphaerae bacterium RIFOXYB12_FULL_65_16]